ncbi:hypothetical protein QJS66_15120 [Kocuria rhizophila]|nr:hypothetical protein QJS66_15120 [Kocuria rhizophila]
MLIYLLGRLPRGSPDEGPKPLTHVGAGGTYPGTAPTEPRPGGVVTGGGTPRARGRTTSAAAPGPAGTRALPAPAGKPLVQKSGTFEELTLEQRTENAVASRPGTSRCWLARSATGGGRRLAFVTGAERPGGLPSETLGWCARGRRTALVNASSTRRHTAALYPEGNSGWRGREVYPLSAVPRMERGTTVTGEVPGLPAATGPARTHSLEVTAGARRPFGGADNADDLGLSTAFEYGMSR